MLNDVKKHCNGWGILYNGEPSTTVLHTWFNSFMCPWDFLAVMSQSNRGMTAGRQSHQDSTDGEPMIGEDIASRTESITSERVEDGTWTGHSCNQLKLLPSQVAALKSVGI
jgi:hypothetical protein